MPVDDTDRVPNHGIPHASDQSGGSLRTFVAIDLPEPVRASLRAVQTQLQQNLRQANVPDVLRWSFVDNLHLTLRFLGDTLPEQRTGLIAHLQGVAQAWSPFELGVAGVGGFPNLRQPRVIWVGVTGALATLQGVQAAVEQAVQATGFAPETKGFSPHLTLARVRRQASRQDVQAAGQAITAFTQSIAAPDLSATGFVVAHLVYYQSELRPSGSVYTPLAVVPLGSL